MKTDMRTGKPTSPEDATTCPTALTLSAWLDGRLPDEEAERVEVHVSRCADCIAIIGDVTPEIAGMVAPERTIIAASSLVAAPAGSPFIFNTSLRRGLAAAAAIGVVWSGYLIGASLHTRTASTIDAGDSGTSIVDAGSDALDVPDPETAEPTAIAAGTTDSSIGDDDASGVSDFLTFGLIGSESDSDSDTVAIACQLFLLEVSP